MSETIPVVIICFNNFTYVEYMVAQLVKYGHENIIIIDNSSTCQRTQKYLNKLKYSIIRTGRNEGHLVWTLPYIYEKLPNRFIITDPDLQFNKNMPKNYVEILVRLSDRYRCQKVGAALDISEPEKMFSYKFSDFGYAGITTICEAQQIYWKNRVNDCEIEAYYADIDTTFCLYTKSYEKNSIRIAGNFTMKHLPWYIDDSITSVYCRYITYREANRSSSIERISRQIYAR